MMKQLRETLWERFFNRLPENAANEAIRVLKQGGTYKDVDFLTLKEAEGQVERYRAEAKSAIADYRRWKVRKSVRLMFGVFHDREGAHLRAHARSMVSLFLDARRDHKDLTDLLMKAIANDEKDAHSSTAGGGHE